VSYFAGIDGGQSSTVAAIGDEHGEIARGSGPPADLVGKPRDPALVVAAISAALEAARSHAGLSRELRFESLVAGVSGFDRGESGEPDLAPLALRTSILHDAAIAHAGALAGGAGIVVLAGTGSVALGNVPGGSEFVRAGGWGYFFGDEGSASWIARTALRRAMLRADRGEPSELGERARAFFGAFSLRAIQHAFAHGELTRPALAAFAADVLETAAEGDADALAVRSAAGRELALLAATVDARLAPAEPAASRPISYAGGLFNDRAFAESFEAELRVQLPRALVVPPALDPAGGALLLARRAQRGALVP
jgi:N-acetylglucosamine kinase-like BadF-type ATPase